MSESTVAKKYIPRLQEKYGKEVLPQLKKEFGHTNDLAVGRLYKIVINMGIGEATQDAKIIEKAKQELAQITGQMPRINRARKAVSNFKIRKGMAIGISVTLRKKMMYEFLDRFISIAVPRIRDFRGFSRRSFDGHGNYSLGISEQTIFPEVDIDKVERTQGMDITICTTAKSDKEAERLLELLGFPFRRK